MSNFCCVCLNIKPDIKQLNTENAGDLEILDALTTCAYETDWVDNNNMLSICFNCCCILQTAYEFYEMCAKSSELLKGYHSLMKSKQPTNSVVFVRNSMHIATENLGAHFAAIMRYMKAQYSHMAERTVEDFLTVDAQPIAEPAPATEKVIDDPILVDDAMDTLKACPEVMDLTDETNEVRNLQNESNDLLKLSNNVKPDQDDPSVTNECFKAPTFQATDVSQFEIDYHCQFCGEVLNVFTNMEDHYLDKHKRFKCKRCSEMFFEESQLNQHLTEKHFKLRTCEFCHEKFTLDVLHGHIYNNHLLPNQGGNPCVYCEKKFSLRKYCTHILTHSEDEPVLQHVIKKMLSIKSKKISRCTETNSHPTCFICSARMRNRQLLHHIINFHKKLQYCRKCNLVLNKSEKSHNKLVHIKQ